MPFVCRTNGTSISENVWLLYAYVKVQVSDVKGRTTEQRSMELKSFLFQRQM